MANPTAHEMLLKAMDFMLEDKTDTDLLSQYNTPFLTGINAAYVDLRQLRGMDESWESVALDANKQFTLDDLADAVSELLDVAQYQDYTADTAYAKATRYNWDYVNGMTVIVSDATASTTVWVKYRKLPYLLVNPNPSTGSGATSPLDLPPHDMDALVFKGLSEIAAVKGDDMGVDKWESKYFQARSGVRPVRKQTTIIDNGAY